MAKKTKLLKYLEKGKIKRSDFLTIMDRDGWAPSKATLSRWLRGLLMPSGASMAAIERATQGKVRANDW